MKARSWLSWTVRNSLWLYATFVGYVQGHTWGANIVAFTIFACFVLGLVAFLTVLGTDTPEAFAPKDPSVVPWQLSFATVFLMALMTAGEGSFIVATAFLGQWVLIRAARHIGRAAAERKAEVEV